MHSVYFGKPSDATSRLVRFYVQRQSNLGSSVLTHPIPARSGQILDFEFGDDIQIRNPIDGSHRQAQRLGLIGVQSYRRVELLIRGQVESFTVFLQPLALTFLFGLPADIVANADYHATDVLGRCMSELQEVLGNCGSFKQRVLAAEKFFSGFHSRAPRLDTIESAANKIVQQQGVCRMDTLARETGLSDCTFQRRFRQSVGLSPKVYARIVRFESALQMKAVSPHLTWTEVACECGYYDQMHMIHDFDQLSAETPSGLLYHLTNVYQTAVDPADKTHLVL
jgi:AraC-like DNA-binding protein